MQRALSAVEDASRWTKLINYVTLTKMTMHGHIHVKFDVKWWRKAIPISDMWK